MEGDEAAEFEEPILTKEDVEEILKRKPCNSRIDELAKPNKRLVLALWESYANRFEPERKERVRVLLQELYAMTPEETEKYFNQITRILNRVVAKRLMKKKILKRCKKRIEHRDKERACRKLRSIVQKMLIYAVKHSAPALVSPRLRCISNLLLEQLCDVCGVEVPDRANSDCDAVRYVNIADFMAIGFENVYFEVQMRKNKEFDLIDEQIRKREMELKTKKKRTSRA